MTLQLLLFLIDMDANAHVGILNWLQSIVRYYY
jgi:hypothetical protein